MLSCEGYKMFYGEMRITPKCKEVKPFTITTTWLYKPEGYWYGDGRSFGKDICEITKDERKGENGE